MADARLRIVIDALNKAGDDLDKLKKDLKGVDQEAGKAEKSTGKFGGGLTSMMTTAAMVAGAVTAVSLAMKQVYETAREGADLLYVEDRFDNLTDSINTTSDALMNDLRVATRGLKSDAELMASATDFMSLGLAKSHDEVVRLASVAGALNMNMNQLVLTLTNRTTMRFDALGVSVDGFDEKVKALEESGLSAEDAFGEAFLQQAEEQIDKVGHAADSATGDFQRFEAAVKNGTNNMKMQIAEVLAPAIGNLADKMENARTAQDNLRMAMEYGLITLEDFNRLASHEGMQRYGDEIANVVDDVDDFTEALKANTEANNFARDPYYQNAEAISAIADSTITAADAMRDLNEQLIFQSASAGLSEDETMALAQAMGLVKDDTLAALEAIKEQNGEFQKTGDLETYTSLVAGLAEGLERLKSKDITIRTTYIEAYGRTVTEGRAGYAEESEEQDRPTGGPVSANNPYLWQEYGYRGERLVTSQNGFVLSRADAKRMVSEAVGMRGQGGYSGPSAEDIARAVRDAMLMVN
jgi:hypothetical protein